MAEEKLDEYKHKNKRPFNYLLVQFNPICSPFLERIYEWEYFYLKLWQEDTSQNDISATLLLDKLNVRGIPIFLNYFAPYNGRVSLSTYLEFICIFAFFTNEQLLPLLYSISNIKSNRLITKEQVFMFFHSLKVPHDSLQHISVWLNDNEDDNGFIQLNTLTAYILNERLLFYSIYSIQSQIIECVIKRDIYVRITRRMKYYSEINDVNIEEPPEPCLSHLQRILLSNNPPPFYYSYSPYNRKLNAEDLLFSIRQRYGYSVRPTRQSSSMLSSTKSVHINNNNNNVSISINNMNNVNGNYKRNLNNNNINNNNADLSLANRKSLTLCTMTSNTLKLTKSQVYNNINSNTNTNTTNSSSTKTSSKSISGEINSKPFRNKTLSAKVLPLYSPTKCLDTKDI